MAIVESIPPLLSVGPMPVPFAIVVLALVAASGVALVQQRIAPRSGTAATPPSAEAPAAPPVSLLLDLLLVAVLAARLGFVLRHLPLYAEAPPAVFSVQDGGYLPAAGIVAGLALALWRTRRQPAWRQPLLIAAGVGVLVWAGLGAAWRAQLADRLRLPDAPLTTLHGEPAWLPAFIGEPLVVNLWATWCPPCRREMPVLADAQRRYPGLRIVFVDQGETPNVVQRYLDRKGLPLDTVLLDATGAVARATGSGALPTTLFFDARGRFVSAHLGALSAPGLAAKLAALGVRPQPSSPGTAPITR